MALQSDAGTESLLWLKRQAANRQSLDEISKTKMSPTQFLHRCSVSSAETLGEFRYEQK